MLIDATPVTSSAAASPIFAMLPASPVASIVISAGTVSIGEIVSITEIF